MTYTVSLAVAGDSGPVVYDWQVTTGDEPDLTAGPVLLDGLVMGWTFAGEDWPATLEPAQATVYLLTRDVAELDALDTNQRFGLTVLDSTGGRIAGMHGRIGEITADHIRRPDPGDPDRDVLWTRYTLSLVDYLPTIDAPIYADTFPTGPINDLLAATAQTADGVGDIDVDRVESGGPVVVGDVGTVALNVVGGSWPDGTLVREVQSRILPLAFNRGSYSQSADQPYVTVPVVAIDISTPTPGPGTPDHLGLLQLRGPFSSDLPATGGLLEGGTDWGLVPLEGRPNCLDAGRVAANGQWRRDGSRAVGAVTVARPSAETRHTVKDPAAAADHRTREIEADLTTAAAARQLATSYLQVAGDEILPAWEIESFTWWPSDDDQLSDEDAGPYSDWWVPVPFVPHGVPPPGPWPWLQANRYALSSRVPADGQNYGGRPAPAVYGRAPVAIFGLQDTANLTRQGDLYVGTVAAATLSISGGACAVTFALRRRIPRPEKDASDYGPAWGGPGVPDPGDPTYYPGYGDDTPIVAVHDASWAWMRAEWPTVTHRGPAPMVVPTMTYRDARLMRAGA